jgi:hypothetical protein
MMSWSLQRALIEAQTPTPADVERTAATLPTTRFRPDLTPTATKLYATLLRADQLLGRSELIERAGISTSSYDRRLSAVRDLDRVSAVHVDGHRRWNVDDASTQATAWVLPAMMSSERGDTTAPLVTYRQPTTPNRDSVSTTVRSRCIYDDTADRWQIQACVTSSPAVNGGILSLLKDSAKSRCCCRLFTTVVLTPQQILPISALSRMDNTGD